MTWNSSEGQNRTKFCFSWHKKIFFVNENAQCFLVLKMFFCLVASIFLSKLMHCCYLGDVQFHFVQLLCDIAIVIKMHWFYLFMRCMIFEYANAVWNDLFSRNKWSENVVVWAYLGVRAEGQWTGATAKFIKS